MGKEKQFEQKVRKFLDEKGAYHVKYFGCAFSQAGVPDLLCCYKGRFLGIELKADKGIPSALQLRNIDKIKEAGGYGIILYPKQFDDFKELIEEIDNASKPFKN